MEPDFWHTRWRDGQIGFHLSEVNPMLVRHESALGADRSSRVLVPLCGKTLDMAYLAAQGHEVVGVELSPLAVQAFFAEQGLAPVVDQCGPFARYRGPRIDLLCGDFFALTPELLGPVGSWFDRAALIALPVPMRERYVQHLSRLLAPRTPGLLITFEYEPETLGGPPFSVAQSEITRLYAADYEVTLLERKDILQAEPRFQQRGATALHESAYGLCRRA